MKKNLTMIILAVFVIQGAFGQKDSKNPFFEEWKTPYGIPPFEKIQSEHFIPAFETGMKEQEKAIQAIVENKEGPTFKNTIEAIENSNQLLNKVSSVFSNLRSANTSSELQKIAGEIFPKLSAHSDNINLNDALFKRIERVYENREKSKLTPEQARLSEIYYKNFIRNGALLNNDEKDRLREINAELSRLTLEFGDNLLAENNNFSLVIDNESDLKGLPASVISAAREAAQARNLPNSWVFTLDKPSMIPFLQYAENRDLRSALYKGYLNRSNQGNEFDNNKNIILLVKNRIDRANLLGYKTHAEFVLEQNMAKAPHKVLELLDQIWEPAIEMAKKEEEELFHISKLENAGIDKIESWDWWFYAEKLRKQKYDLDEEELRPYFKLENVRDGIFWVTNKLYGLSFKELKNAPIYHPEVVTYEVIDLDKKQLGVLMMDFHPRASKRGGAWCTTYQSAYYKDGKRVLPIVSIVCNFTRPTGNLPALLNIDEVETFFHEFGHAIHSLVSNCQYKGSISVPRDFVELPSQIMEHWATQPLVLKQYAKHYKTNKAIPDELIKKISNSSKFNQGFATVEFTAAAYLDMLYHSMPLDEGKSPSQFEEENMKKIGLISAIAPRYRSTYFQHIFAGGYSSGYYSYLWSEVLDSDAFLAFEETGDIFNKKVATDFRKKILEKGNTKDPLQMYLDFRGKEPSIEALLKNRGLL
ncbi:MAG: M3 family metallopeptidase [Bacteroidales bacterium]|nr:M3 family metallopeptidase [Bacteroidales bacterium]